MKIIIPLLAAVIVSTASARPAHCGCQHLYGHHHHQAVVAVQPIVVYAVGDNLRIEAAVEKALARREQLNSPKKLESSILQAKCSRCHVGDSAKGGFDLTQGVDDAHFRRIVGMLGESQDVPDAMKGVIESLTPAEKGSITSEMLKARPITQPQEQSGILR